jgi:hypothetical protein
VSSCRSSAPGAARPAAGAGLAALSHRRTGPGPPDSAAGMPPPRGSVARAIRLPAPAPPPAAAAPPPPTGRRARERPRTTGRRPRTWDNPCGITGGKRASRAASARWVCARRPLVPALGPLLANSLGKATLSRLKSCPAPTSQRLPGPGRSQGALEIQHPRPQSYEVFASAPQSFAPSGLKSQPAYCWKRKSP